MFFRRNPFSPLFGFLKHLIVYVCVNFFLFVLNFVTGGEWWFHHVMLAWGIGLFFHAMGAVLSFLGRMTRFVR
ncbi:MAG: 2TM domain-containing protein [Bryobacterales bacterium]|nr:2TM domain-containing protein [Bryobacterales bacterium]